MNQPTVSKHWRTIHWNLAITRFGITRIRLQRGWSHGSRGSHFTGLTKAVSVNRMCAVQSTEWAGALSASPLGPAIDLIVVVLYTRTWRVRWREVSWYVSRQMNSLNIHAASMVRSARHTVLKSDTPNWEDIYDAQQTCRRRNSRPPTWSSLTAQWNNRWRCLLAERRRWEGMDEWVRQPAPAPDCIQSVHFSITWSSI